MDMNAPGGLSIHNAISNAAPTWRSFRFCILQRPIPYGALDARSTGSDAAFTDLPPDGR
jgi:hypothetical protein